MSDELFELHIPEETAQGQIHLFRGFRVMLDSNVAALYEVDTKRLIQAIKRHLDRFPKDFLFQLSREEFDILKHSSGEPLPDDVCNRRTPPYVFTEAGVAMAGFVLDSPRAIRASEQMIRTFLQMRQMCMTKDQFVSDEELATLVGGMNRALQEMESKHDSQMQAILQVLQNLSTHEPEKKR